MLKNIDKISPLSQEILDFLSSLAASADVRRIIVFGSRSFGDYEQYSDLDLAIDAPSMRKIDWLRLKEYVTYDLRTVIRVSLVRYSTNPEKLRERINKSGIVIYAR